MDKQEIYQDGQNLNDAVKTQEMNLDNADDHSQVMNQQAADCSQEEGSEAAEGSDVANVDAADAADVTDAAVAAEEADVVDAAEAAIAADELDATDVDDATGVADAIGATDASDATAAADAVADAADESEGLAYMGIPYDRLIACWWRLYNEGKEPVRANAQTLIFELALGLRTICDNDRKLLGRIIPCYGGLSEAVKMSCIDAALAEKRTQMPRRMRDVIESVREDLAYEQGLEDMDAEQDGLVYYDALPEMPQGVKESISAVGPHLAMPAIFAITPAIGMLATGVRIQIHGHWSQLNLISYIAGDFASGKGNIDPVVGAWVSEVKRVDKAYLAAEEDWRARKRAAKNKSEQPEEPKYPVRCLTLNSTVANLAERLANTLGKHAFSFTPEADTVAQRWRTAMGDFSVMLRQAYDGTPYDREAKSVDAVNVHIEKLLWNVVMCGTPDALFRVVTNYTDGFLSRLALARTPDNTFAPLAENLYHLTDAHEAKIQQVAHLLPLMSGDVELEKLEATGRRWLEVIRLEGMRNDDKTLARMRFRICPTTMRMMTCLMLCRVAERLIQDHGVKGAEDKLRNDPTLWRTMVVEEQTPEMLEVFDLLADYMLDNALYFFRQRIEAAFSSSAYPHSAFKRSRKGKNDTIFQQLKMVFTAQEAREATISLRGCSVSQARVGMMLYRWEQQGLIERNDEKSYRKLLRTTF